MPHNLVLIGFLRIFVSFSLASYHGVAWIRDNVQDLSVQKTLLWLSTICCSYDENIYSTGQNIPVTLAFSVANICTRSHMGFLWDTNEWRKNDLKRDNRFCFIPCVKWSKLVKNSGLLETAKVNLDSKYSPNFMVWVDLLKNMGGFYQNKIFDFLNYLFQSSIYHKQRRSDEWNILFPNVLGLMSV